MIVWFDKCAIQQITTPTQARAAIASLNTIIDTLVQAAAAAALNANIKEYNYNDNMTHVRMEYKDVGAIAAQIKALMALQQVFLQMPGMNSRVIRLVDSKNMPNLWSLGTTITTTVS
jgi:hypothetical protein